MQTYEIHYDDTAGVYEAYAVHADGTYEWIAACDTRAQAEARISIDRRQRAQVSA